MVSVTRGVWALGAVMLAMSVTGCSQQEPVAPTATAADRPAVKTEGATRTAAANPLPAGYKVYGAPFESKGETLAVPAILADADGYNGKAVQVAGTIDAVCENRGCWLTLRDGKKIVRTRFVESGACTNGFFVPRDAGGHKVILQGTFKKEQITEARAKHFLEESNAPQEEIDKIVGPQDVLSIIATTVAIEGGDKLSEPVARCASGG